MGGLDYSTVKLSRFIISSMHLKYSKSRTFPAAAAAVVTIVVGAFSIGILRDDEGIAGVLTAA